MIFELLCDSKMSMCTFSALVLNVLFAQPISPAGCMNNYPRTYMMHKTVATHTNHIGRGEARGDGGIWGVGGG